jgi:hypothetical protein
MEKLNSRWEMNGGWLKGLSLNIWIAGGEEYFASTTTELRPIGDSGHHVSRLSELARLGSIWTTKNIMKG